MRVIRSARSCVLFAAILAVIAAMGALAPMAFGHGPNYVVQSESSATTDGLPLAAPTWTKLPITSSSHPLTGDAWTNKPFGLSKHGFVEEEFLVSGPARVYQSVPNSDYKTEVVGNSSYTTRAVIRRPKKMKDWSGNVIVEYMNASDGIDDQIIWGRVAPKLFESNDVYVGFTGKGNIIPVLQKFDPARYGSIDMHNPVPAAQQACGLLPDEPGFDPNLSKLYENGLLWDMWSEVGLSLKSSNSPLGKPAKVAYAVGESQSARALMNYYRWFGGNRTTVGKKPVYDGFLGETEPFSSGGTGALNQCAAPLPASDPQRVENTIPDRGAPYMAINSQFDLPLNPPKPSRSYRLWEVVGADHVDRQMYDHLYPPAADLTKAGVLGPEAFPWFTFSLIPPSLIEYTPDGWECDDTRAPEVGLPQTEQMAYEWLKKWTTKGTQPPVASYVTQTEPGASPSLDADGNVLGGLRLPYIQAPIAHYLGGRFGNCADFHVPFSPERLAQLYPTHGAYVSKVSTAARELSWRGFLSPEAAQDMVYRAEDRPIP